MPEAQLTEPLDRVAEKGGSEGVTRWFVVAVLQVSAGFGGDPAAVGRTVVLGNRGHVVVGVAPRGFRGIESAAIDAWILLAVLPELCSFAGTNLLEAATPSGCGR